jgi:hypothetical protein
MDFLNNMEYIEKNPMNKDAPSIIVGGFQINNLLLLQNNMSGGGGQRTHFQLFERLKNLGIPAGLYVSTNINNFTPNNIKHIKLEYQDNMTQLFDDFTSLVGINSRLKSSYNKTKSNKIQYKNHTKRL